MASAVLHIKDSYYFEVPKFMYRWNASEPGDFPDWWIRNDAEFQQWQAGRLIEGLQQLPDTPPLPRLQQLQQDWSQWQQEEPINFGRPLHVYLQMHHEVARQSYREWVAEPEHRRETFEQFLDRDEWDHEWFIRAYESSPWREQWEAVKQDSADVSQYVATAAWAPEKIEAYNKALHGKVLIPQPFGELRNAYEAESGFCISRFMIVQVVVVVLLVVIFSWLARRVVTGGAPKGRAWNLLEALLLFIRNEIARPAIGKKDGDRFVPILWTMFLFILGCNLMGLVPWVGGPTQSFGVTLALAGVTLATGMFSGMRKLGFAGYWKNLVPGMKLPLVMALLIIPVLFAIEALGLLIKHGVLGVRLLANMVAGHFVLLGIMDLAFSPEGAASDYWWLLAIISIIAATLFTGLELFIALLQAYIFTFLSALFIGMQVHHH
jgi:F-type H+-transporting ATPase subunit a